MKDNDSVSDVRGRMHRLRRSCDRGITDGQHKIIKDVYRNFTSIHKTLQEHIGRNIKDHEPTSISYSRMMKDVGMVITFCRWQLNWMYKEDGLMNKSSVLLLEKIEVHFLLLIKGVIHDLSRVKGDRSSVNDLRFEYISPLAQEIEAVFRAAISRTETYLMPSYLVIGNEFIMEFLNQVHEDLQFEGPSAIKERKTMRGYLVLLRYYFEFTANKFNGQEMNDFLIYSQLVASKMAYYSFFSNFAHIIGCKETFESIRHGIESDVHLGCLRAALVLPQHVSSSIPVMNNELLTIYVNCIQDNLLGLLKDEALIDQFTILQSRLTFLIILLADSGLLAADVQEKLWDIRVRLQALVINVGYIIMPCFNNESNGSLVSSLFNFIESTILLNEESIQIMKGSVSDIRPMIHLLCQCFGDSDDLYESTVKEVYVSFTSIHKTAIALLENIGRKFHEGPVLPLEYQWMRVDMGMVVTFCRCQLNWMMVKDETHINISSALLLETIERHFLLIINSLTDNLSLEELDPSEISALRHYHFSTLVSEIDPLYQASISRRQASFRSSYLLIGNKFILEFLDQVHEDLQSLGAFATKERITMRGYMVLLRYYIKFTADRINSEEMNDFLISSQIVASKMAYYSFFLKNTYRTNPEEKFASVKHRLESDISFGCLRSALVLQQHASSCIRAMNSELLTIYVNCFQDNLLGLLREEAFTDLTSPMTDPLMILPMDVSMTLPADSRPPTTADHEKLSNIRAWFRSLVKNVKSLSISCFNGEMKGSITSVLSDSIRKVDLMTEEIIEFIYSIVLGRAGKESLRTHRMHFLIILLENLEDLIRSKSDLTMTLKDQFDAVDINLVLFRSFILNIEGYSTTHEGSKNHEESDCNEKEEQIKTLVDEMQSLRNYIQLDIDHQINGEEMSELLISAQVTVFEMVCHHLFKRYGEVHWWKVYFRTKDHVVSHIRVGVLRTAVLSLEASNTEPLSNELLMGYLDCIQDNMTELVTDESRDHQLKSQIQRLNEDLSILVELLIKYSAEKWSETKLRFQSFFRYLGPVICSCFNDEMKGTIMHVLSDSITKVDLMIEKIIDDMYSIILGKPGKESLRTHWLHILIIRLENLEDLIRSKSNLTMTSNDQFDAVDMNIVLFRSFILNIEGNNTTDEGSKNNEESDDSEKYEQIKAVAGAIRSLRNYFQSDIDHQINGQELIYLLISAQVSVFEMVCRHLFRKYGEVHWWKVYFRTKDHVVSHIRAGVLRAAVLSLQASNAEPLSDELLMGYVDCIQDNITELVTDEPGDQLKSQIERLHQDLSFPVLLLIKYYADQDKQAEIKLRFQALLSNIGSVICSCFNNQLTNLVTGQSVRVADLLEKLNFFQEETQGFQYRIILHRIRQESPGVHLPGFFDLLLHNWKDFMGCESDTVRNKKDQFQTIHEALDLFRSFIQNFTTNPTRDEESRKLWNDIVEAGYVAEFLLESFDVEACPVSCTSHWISEFTEHIKLIEAGVMEFNWKNANDKNPALANVVVGFEVEMSIIETRLYYSRQQLDVVSIVGMPGSGKTALARKFYEDPSAEKHFDVRVWCVASHDYNNKELFLTILGSKFEVTELIRRNSETELSLMVHKMLKGRRYFIVLDDVRAIDAFTGLENFFPDDNIGSRIMLTSRNRVIVSQVKYHSDPIDIGLLTDEESWDLLGRKIYPRGKCPSELCELGKKIAQKCKGLPLAVVVVAGFLAKSVEKHELWEEVAENLSSSYLYHDSQTQRMGPLELSYKFLPDHLKPLFLYLGAFPEDREIPVDKLMWLWIAEGFVLDTGLRSLEMEAEMSLMELIDRNLIMVSKRSSDGRVKACHIHDLLHDMCLAKAKEVKFMEQIHVYQELSESVTFHRRLSVFLKRDTPISLKPLIPYKKNPVFSVCPPLRALLLFDTTDEKIQGQDHNPDFSSLKLSRAIHSESTKINIEDIIKLLHLRYISIRTDCNNIPESLSNLKNLETLIIERVGGEIVLPCTIWEMVKLRHLHVNDLASFSDAQEDSPNLTCLITLSTPAIDSGKANNFFRKVPNVQKLRCILGKENSYSNKDTNECYDLESLHKLQSLKASYYGSVQSPSQFNLPKSLRKLSLSKFSLKLSQVSIFQNLPNLEVLKLRSAAVEDEFWDTGDDEFPKLRVLKLDNLNIKTWEASEDNFPCLEKLVLERCKQLEEIPFSLGGICSLEKIDVIWCSHSAAISAKEIEEEQTKAGNSSLNVYIYPPQLEYDQSSSETE